MKVYLNILKDVWKSQLTKYLAEIFRKNILFIQDNVPIHKAGVIKS